MQLATGTTLLHYTIEAVLGIGGFGITYKAWDNKHHRRVAIKESFPANWVTRGDNGMVVAKAGYEENIAWATRHFITEANLLYKLNHPNIIHVYERFRTNNTEYFVMEFLQAMPLTKTVRSDYWSEERIRGLLTSLLSALAHIHSHHICHRDIKLTNIMLRRDGSPVIIDFGSAKQEASNPNNHTMGFISSSYTAPEQLADNDCLLPSIDLYALAVSLYCLLSGKLPPTATQRHIKDRIILLTTMPELSKRYSHALLSTIDKALALNAKDRTPTAQAWLNLLNDTEQHSITKDTETPAPVYTASSTARTSASTHATQPTNQSPSVNSDDVIIPLPQIVGYIGKLIFIIGLILLLPALYGIFLGDSLGISHVLNSFFLPSLFFTILGIIVCIAVRLMNNSSS